LDKLPFLECYDCPFFLEEDEICEIDCDEDSCPHAKLETETEEKDDCGKPLKSKEERLAEIMARLKKEGLI
jgi:hypothetical protein